MALRTPLFLGNPAVQHTAENDRLGLIAAMLRAEAASTATSRPLTSRSGALVGPAGTMGEVTLLSNTGYTINPARFYIQGTATTLAGVFEVINDAVSPTLTVTAQHASQWRKSYVGVWVRDSFPGNAGPDDGQWGVQDGALAASNPALPSAGSLPANFLALGELLIPPVGQAVTFTPYYPRVGSRTGILPVTASDVIAGAFLGEYRDHPTEGPQRWDGTAWRGGWETYTPTWAAAVGGPTIGNGSLIGRFRKVGRAVDVDIALTIGSTTNGASGEWTFALPFQAAAGREHILLAKAYTGAGDFAGVARITAGTSLALPSLPGTTATSVLSRVRNADNAATPGTGVPVVAGNFTFTTGHNLIVTGRYESAA